MCELCVVKPFNGCLLSLWSAGSCQCLRPDPTSLHIPEPLGPGCPCRAAEHLTDQPDAHRPEPCRLCQCAGKLSPAFHPVAAACGCSPCPRTAVGTPDGIRAGSLQVCCCFGEDIEIVPPIHRSMCVYFLSTQYLVRCWTFYKLTWYGSALSWAGVSGAVLQCEDCVVCIECVCVWTGAGIMGVSVWWLCGVYWMCVCVDRSRHHGCVSVMTVWCVLNVCVWTGAGIMGVSVWGLCGLSVEHWVCVCVCWQEQALWVCQCDDCGLLSTECMCVCWQEHALWVCQCEDCGVLSTECMCVCVCWQE